MPTRRDLVLLLGRWPFGESSLVVHGLSREHGRVHLLAKGAYRPTSRFFCVLDLFHTLELEWSHQSGRELDLVRQGRLTERRRSIAEDLERYHAALSMLELSDLAARPEQPGSALFDGLAAGLSRLERRLGPADLALVVFELGFLQNLGLAPALERCAACGRAAPPVSHDGRRAAFSAGAGGRLCMACSEDARRAGRRVGTLPVEVLAVASDLTTRSYETLVERAPTPDTLQRVRDLIERFTNYHLESRPRTQRSFLAAPNRNAPDPNRNAPDPNRPTPTAPQTPELP